MANLLWNLKDDLHDFELAESGAQPGSWDGKDALYLEGFHTIPVLLRDKIHFDCFRITAEVAVPGPFGFIGLVFGARDPLNYELVYLSPGGDGSIGDIQYDPIMNGSSTWQIYQGPSYQASADFPAGKWTKYVLDVQLHSVKVYVGDETAPQLVISNLQHGRAATRIGFWGNLPCYIRNFSVEEIHPPILEKKEVDLKKLADDSYITEWLVSKPYISEDSLEYQGTWSKAVVEENGCLNLNRLYSATEKGTTVQTKCLFFLNKAAETLLSLGFSDRIKLWINDVEVFQGESIWNPPGTDGRIRADQVTIPIKWSAGVNSIRAEVSNLECMFGWGLLVRSGLPNPIDHN